MIGIFLRYLLCHISKSFSKSFYSASTYKLKTRTNQNMSHWQHDVSSQCCATGHCDLVT